MRSDGDLEIALCPGPIIKHFPLPGPSTTTKKPQVNDSEAAPATLKANDVFGSWGACGGIEGTGDGLIGSAE
jgi:hypothetical protein